MSEYSLLEREFIDLPTGRLNAQLYLSSNQKIAIMGENGIGKTSLFKYLKMKKNMSFSCSFLNQERFSPLSRLKVKEVYQILISEEVISKDLLNGYIEKFEFNYCDDKYVQNLSGGENQILKLCLSFSQKVDVYFLDEPFSALSEKNQKILKEILMKFDSAVVMIDHNFKRAQMICDKVYFLALGKNLELREINV